jgi:hypothetical protein
LADADVAVALPYGGERAGQLLVEQRRGLLQPQQGLALKPLRSAHGQIRLAGLDFDGLPLHRTRRVLALLGNERPVVGLGDAQQDLLVRSLDTAFGLAALAGVEVEFVGAVQNPAPADVLAGGLHQLTGSRAPPHRPPSPSTAGSKPAAGPS